MCGSRAKGVVLGCLLCSVLFFVAFFTTQIPKLEFQFDVPAGISANNVTWPARRVGYWVKNLPAQSLVIGGTFAEGTPGPRNNRVDFPPQPTIQLAVLLSAVVAVVAILIGLLLIVPKQPNIRLLIVLCFTGFVISLGVNVYFVPLDMTPLAKNLLDAKRISGCASAAACPPTNVGTVTMALGLGICAAWASTVLLLVLTQTFYETLKDIRAGRVSASDVRSTVV